jgi:putative hydrolase of the HAD superfamily
LSENRCILFDLDGTLYNSSAYFQMMEEEIAELVSEQLSINYENARLLLSERRKKLGTLTKSLESLGIDRVIFFEALASRVEPAEYMSNDLTVHWVLARLRENGFKIGLVSNSGRPVVAKVLQALRLDQSSFEAMVTSSDVQPKPSPEPFRLALDLLSCNAESAVYVGDRDEAELRPAKHLGIRTILLDRSGKSSRRWADVVVKELSQVPKAAKQILPSA